MNKQAMIFNDPKPVSKARHGGWTVAKRSDYGFARDLNAVPLTVTEFGAAAREYPIVFSESDGVVGPTALLGLRDHENLFVDDSGHWNADYIPAFIRRYPFVFAHDAESGVYTLCIDEGCDLCGENGDGEPLFDEAGEPTRYLKGMTDLVKNLQRAMQESQAFGARLSELGLLQRSEIKFKLEEEKQAVVRGFLLVDRDRLRDLPGEKVAELHQNGDLERIYTHLVSLSAIDELHKLLGSRPPMQ